MTNKKDFFFKKQLNSLPFFFRNHKITELQIQEKSDKHKGLSLFDHIPAYNSELIECKLPQKPICKIITLNEQKKF